MTTHDFLYVYILIFTPKIGEEMIPDLKKAHIFFKLDGFPNHQLVT